MNHIYLCERAVQWLRGTKRCSPAFCGIGSTAELPDAIGWSSNGSIVVECKTSYEDFLRDARKKHSRRMGDRRYFMCQPGVIPVQKIEERHPDHGLVYVLGRKVLIIREAQMRPDYAHRSEIRYLRFALLHAWENLLRAGYTVDLNELCKPWAAANMTIALSRHKDDGTAEGEALIGLQIQEFPTEVTR